MNSAKQENLFAWLFHLDFKDELVEAVERAIPSRGRLNGPPDDSFYTYLPLNPPLHFSKQQTTNIDFRILAINRDRNYIPYAYNCL